MMKANGTPIPDLFGFAQAKRIEKIKPVVGTSESTFIGRYAEFMVCAYLSKAGHNVFHIDTNGYDLIVEYQGSTFRVDVKGTTQSHSGPFKEMAYWSIHKSYWIEGMVRRSRRSISDRDCDMLALFYLPLDAVAFVALGAKEKASVRVPLAQLRADPYGIESFKNVVERLRSRNGW
jgi:hypothetical protein